MSSSTKAIKRRNIDNKRTDDNTKSNPQNKTENKPLRYGPMPNFTSLRVWSKGILMLSIIIVVWFTSKNGKETVLAPHKELVKNRGQTFECSKSFETEISSYPGCKPKKCGRFASDYIVTSSEADILLKLAKRGLALSSSDGGASILDLHSGALSHGKKFLNVYSLDSAKQIFGPAELAIYKMVREKIKTAIEQNFGLNEGAIHLTYPTFFSKLTNDEPVTIHDEYWHKHVDKETYESFHYTSLLYLSDYERDFSGGRFIFVDSSPSQNVTVEPRKGRVLMFSSGAENVHFVERVKIGTRYAITVSFTCNRDKAIRDPFVPTK